MKKLLISILMISSISMPLLADMVYDPARNLFMTKPESPAINQGAYAALILGCHGIATNIMSLNNNQTPEKAVLLAQYTHYLKRIGTPTALRLIEDLRKDELFYPDGSVAHTLLVLSLHQLCRINFWNN